MNIEKLLAREIFNACGHPTIECELILEDGSLVTSTVPSMCNQNAYGVAEQFDGGQRLQGKGILKSIELLEHIIAPLLIDREPDVVRMDQEILMTKGLQGKVGANTLLAVSIAVVKAQAISFDLQTYELIAKLCGYDTVTLPLPLFSVVTNKEQKQNKFTIQEMYIAPLGAQNFRDCMEHAAQFFYTFKNMMIKKNLPIVIADSGAFYLSSISCNESLDMITEAMQKNNSENIFKIGIRIGADTLFDAKKNKYNVDGKADEAAGLIKYYEKLIKKYPIFSIEDGIASSDIEGWALLKEALGEKLQIIGNDIFATNPERIYQGILANLANSVAIIPSHIGTITETLQAIGLAKEHGWTPAIKNAYEETNEDFIADLAVGTSSGQIYAGGFYRGEHTAKYNRLLAIEDYLTLAMLEEE